MLQYISANLRHVIENKYRVQCSFHDSENSHTSIENLAFIQVRVKKCYNPERRMSMDFYEHSIFMMYCLRIHNRNGSF